VAEEIWKNKGHRGAGFRIVDEPVAGQMHARRKGVREAKYGCIIFCDDDNLLDNDYVLLAGQMMEKDNMIGAAGGQNHPATDAGEYPAWFDDYKDKYAIGIPADQSCDVTEKGFVLGAGLVTRATLFLEMFDHRYPSLLNGRSGERLSTGDDFEYCKRLLLRGYKLYYEKNLKLRHFIPKERLVPAYREKLMAGIDEAGKILDQYDTALRFYNRNKYKKRWRLFLLSPLRVLMAVLGLSKRNATEEKITFFYTAPFNLPAQPVKSLIKKFMYRK
jgi:hypothetical protein